MKQDFEQQGRTRMDRIRLATIALLIATCMTPWTTKAVPLDTQDLKCGNFYVDVTWTNHFNEYTNKNPVYGVPQGWWVYQCDCRIFDYSSSGTNVDLWDLRNNSPIRPLAQPHSIPPHHLEYWEFSYWTEDFDAVEWVDSYNYLTVTAVADGAFRNKTELRCVRLPGTCLTIGAWAFEGCTALASVELQDGVESIGDYAFGNCVSLTNLVIPDSVTDIGYGAFDGCTGLVSVKLGNGITNLPSFRWNTNLVSVTLGKGITSIPEYAFEGCAALERISIPDGVGSIGGSAFFNCVSLKEIVIPDGVTDIGYGAFGNCVSLKDIAIPDSVTALGDGAFSGCSALESAAIGRGVTDEDVLRGAFSYGCNGLERFLVAEDHPVWAGVDGILFTRDMTRLVRFPGGRGGAYALPAGILSIAAESFYDCTHLTAVVFSSSLLRIEDFAFSGCSGLVSVAIPDSVVMIGEYAFNGCESMTGVEIGEGVAEIGEGAFGACSALERIGVSAGNPAYLSEDGVLFSKDKRLLVQYPAGKDGAYAVPQGVVHIGVLAFSGCDGLTAVDMPDSVESIGWRAFAWCNALERVFFGAGVRNIGETNNMQWVFADDRALSAIDVAGDNPAFAGRDGVLFSKDFETLVLCPPGKGGSYRVPEGVERIGACAFSFNAGLTGVEFPSTLTDIGEAAFSACPGLTEVSVPEGVTNIGYQAFADCPALASVSLPDSLIHLGEYAFGLYDDYESEFTEELYDTTSVPGVKLVDGWAVHDWYASYPEVLDLSGVRGIADGAFRSGFFLRSVILPDGLVSIGAHAFDYTGLESVTIPDSVVFIGDGAFSGCRQLEAIGAGKGNAHFAVEDGVLFEKDKKSLLCFPAGKGGTYVIPEGVEAIGNCAFESCDSLTEAVLPESLAEIGQAAFLLCTGLTEMTLPKGVESIGRWAFNSCNGLGTLHVPVTWKTQYLEETFWSQYAGVPEECEILYYEPEGGTPETQTTPVPVLHSWLQENAAGILAANGDDYEAAAFAKAANGRAVWECYVADISATDSADFKAELAWENGKWVVKPVPDRGTNRTYTVEGSEQLGGEEDWGEVTDKSRFFRVKVALPQ